MNYIEQRQQLRQKIEPMQTSNNNKSASIKKNKKRTVTSRAVKHSCNTCSRSKKRNG